ncbi:amidohydrolase [Coniochaeta ligniaria NRRL 30616]|uniref:Amidohydrolase n=1 Tax=Coniochaeta ligniaria NRRL 30616 TaxID=1408157 RepID=A0A1J7IJ12_9PEZI|nr:amidohydrolase [Coniochaeta ligniaria NRRL 30616]
MAKMKVDNVILPSHGSEKTFDVTITDNIVTSVRPSSAPHHCPSLLLPSLCHPHLHLDKAYLLTSNNPTYAHLAPKTGTFSEALTTTAQAKSLYTEDDLYLRGAQLLSTIYTQGATSARTFVEVDATTGTLPLTVARRLKREFAHLIEIQIVAFAQEPLFSKDDGEANRLVLEGVLASEAAADISVLGTTPYVEVDEHAMSENIHWAIETAIDKCLHLDFHLDYNLKPTGINQGQVMPWAFNVVTFLLTADWNTMNKDKTVVLGHCTQLSHANPRNLRHAAHRIRTHNLPIHFVGLPTSDLFMMGRDHYPKPRGTLPVMDFIREPYCLNACLGVNNVGNAFTPYGTGDPLTLASWGVGIYQAGTEKDAETLYGCVSWRARKAIGLASEQDEKEREETDVVEGMRWKPMLLVENKGAVEVPGPGSGDGVSGVMAFPARQRVSIRDVVWDPPEVNLRKVIR